MSKATLWILGVLLGLVIVLATALTLFVALAVALALLPLARQPNGRAAVSGALISFGALWIFLISAESSSGGTLDNANFWLAVGLLPLALGLILLAWMVTSHAREKNSELPKSL
jgi:hypothetical protein